MDWEPVEGLAWESGPAGSLLSTGPCCLGPGDVTGVLLPKCPVRGWLLPAEIREGGQLSGVTRSITPGLPWWVPRFYRHKVAQTKHWLKSQKLILLQSGV